MRDLRNVKKLFYCKKILYVRKHFYSLRTDVRVRFAPSPTGLLHLGGLRTALYNYFFAKSNNGVFILRIEDTDQTRLVPDAIEKLQADLEWVGIIPDEGPYNGGNYGPYKQSERLILYQQEVDKLLNNGSAYHCFCSEKRLNLVRKEAIKLSQVPKYDNKCRHLSKDEVATRLRNGEDSCIRFKLSSGGQTYNDLIYGSITHDVAAVEGDPIILKTDGFPTYHLANVIDDHFMKISHVLRGVEWQPSTAKHLLIYQAFKWKPPLFGHLPLLVNSDGSKFSKRQGALSVESYRQNGFFPRSLSNFVTFTGGFSRMQGEPHEPRTCSIADLIKIFDLSYINTQPCRLMFDQLPEFNRAELSRQISDENCIKSLIIQLKQLIIDKISRNNSDQFCDLQLDDNHIKYILSWCKPRVTKLDQLIEPNMMFLWTQPSLNQINKSDLHLYKDILISLVEEISGLKEYNEESVKVKLKEFSKNHNLKFNHFMGSLRLCLSGLKEGPGVAEIMDILGKESVCKRLTRVTEMPHEFKSIHSPVKL